MKTNFTTVMAAFALMAAIMMGCKKPVEEVKAPMVAMIEDSVVVTHNSALLYAEVTDNGGGLITGCGFCYGALDGASDTVYCDVNSGKFSFELKGLSPSTDYTCKAFADNDAGRGYSEAFNFTTQGDPMPVVKTYDPTEITHSSAMVSGSVVSDGGQQVMERGICYSTSEHPTIDGPHVVCGTGLGYFETSLSDLAANTRLQCQGLCQMF